MKAKFLSITLILALLLLTCTGCGSKEEAGLRLAAAAPYVDDAKAQTYAAQVKLSGENTLVSMVSSNVAPPQEESAPEEAGANPSGAAAEMAGTANAMKLSAMMAAKELDVMLCDAQTAARFARSEGFYPLEDLFTEEELAAIAPERRMAYEKLDENNNATDEMLPACGIDVSQNEELQAFIVSDQIGVFVVANATNLEAAKEFVLQIVNG